MMFVYGSTNCGRAGGNDQVRNLDILGVCRDVSPASAVGLMAGIGRMYVVWVHCVSKGCL